MEVTMKIKQLYTNNLFTEPMGAEAIFCASGFSKKDVYLAEICMCGNPYKCTCNVMNPPEHRHPRMSDELFDNSRPMLLWTIYNTKNPDIKISFGAKIEQEVFDEVKRLNKECDNWYYKEETEFNHPLKVDYKNSLSMG